jgi:CubicO group peptidase (beta-lactamase class C family)
MRSSGIAPPSPTARPLADERALGHRRHRTGHCGDSPAGGEEAVRFVARQEYAREAQPPTLRIAPPAVGSYSWGGIYNTYFWVDPEHKLIGILATQLFPSGHLKLPEEFQRLTYAAMTAPFTHNGRPLAVTGKGKHDVIYSTLPLDPKLLVKGSNRTELLSDPEHHGIEVLQPGPALVVRCRK